MPYLNIKSIRSSSPVYAVSLYLTIALALLSPGATASDPDDTSAGGDLKVMVLATPTTLNSALGALPPVTIPGAQLFASLFRLNAHMEPQPYLAKTWRLSEDKHLLSIDIVANALFHDGHPITSRDVAYSIRAVKKNHAFNTMLAPIDRVDTPTPQRIEIRLKHPYPALFTALSAPLTPILPAHVFDDGTPLARHPANKSPVGSGPFRFERWETDNRLILRRFDDFFIEGRPYLDRITLEYSGLSQFKFALEAGESDLMLVITATGGPLKVTSSKMRNVQAGKTGIDNAPHGVTFNTRRAPFDDRRVRQAFAYAADLKGLYGDVMAERCKLTQGIFPPTHPYAATKLRRYDLDLEKAERLFVEAGYPRTENGHRFSVEFLIGWDDINSEAFVNYLRWHFGTKFGINLKPVITDNLGTYIRRMSTGQFDLGIDARIMWGFDPAIAIHHIYRGDNRTSLGLFSNFAGYNNPEVDSLLNQALSEPDDQQRRTLYEQFQTILNKDLPSLWICHVPFQTIAHRALELNLDSPWAVAAPYDELRWHKKTGDQ